MSELAAYAYLLPTPTSFWSWGDDGRVLLWADGTTIAFLPEVEAAARRLAPVGLPPFSALAVALAATRDTWTDTQRAALSTYAQAALSPGAQLPGILQDLLRDVLARLDALAALPPDVRKGPEARALLVEMLFEAVPPLLKPPATRPVLNLLAQRIPDLAEPEAPSPNLHAAEALALLKTLASARLLTDVEAIRLRQRTGLEQTPTAPDLHISELVRGLLNELRGDPQLAGLAKLARAVLAVIATPRRLTPETELPLGGVSDLTNRGPLDRLLLTELAHDDLTLAVRVALNEALYLRRESPRSPQSFTRAVLLDCGIRLWGVPRVFSTAVALAIAATTPKEATLTLWSAHGPTLLPVNLATREGLLAHLERLEPDPHPGPALPALTKCLQDLPAQRSETIVVTHPDVAADTDFQQALHAADLYPFLLATVEGSGRFNLESRSAAGHKPLAQATLKLDDLLAGPTAQPPLVDISCDLPAFFRLLSSPFRLAIWADLAHALSSPHHGLIAAHQRQLHHWPRPGRSHTIAAPLPTGHLIGVNVFENEGVAVTLIWDAMDRTLHLWSVHLQSRQVHAQRIIDVANEPTALGGHRGTVLVLHQNRVDTHSLRRGVRLGTRAFPDSCRIIGPRFLLRPLGTIAAIACEPTGIHLLDVPLPPSPIAVFERLGTDGPLGLYPDGSVRTTLDQTPVPPTFLDQPLTRFRCRISSDGSRLLTETPGITPVEHQGLDLSLPQPAWQPLAKANPNRFLLGPHADYAVDRGISLRRHMERIYVNRDSDLVLISRRGKTLVLDTQARRLVAVGPSGRDHLVHFKHITLYNNAVHGIQVAAWPDGSRAWLDPRGFLHLRSSDPGLPELSILLADADASMTAWSSQGNTYGLANRLEEPPTGNPAQLAQLLRAFVGRLA